MARSVDPHEARFKATVGRMRADLEVMKAELRQAKLGGDRWERRRLMLAAYGAFLAAIRRA
jgi:hypothetical protein